MPTASFPARSTPSATKGRVLIFAPANDATVMDLTAALESQGHPCIVCAQLGQGLVLLGRKPSTGPDITLVVVTAPLTGLGVPAIAAALRALPGRATVPILLAGAVPPGMARCAPLPPDHAEVCRLAGLDPDFWPLPAAITAPVQPAPVAPTGPALLDPGPLQHLDRVAPGSLGQVAAAMIEDLDQAERELARLLVPDLPPQLPLMAKLAHKLKGSSGSVGGMELSRLCAELEHAARAGEAERSLTEIPRIQAAIPRLRAALQALAAQPVSG